MGDWSEYFEYFPKRTQGTMLVEGMIQKALKSSGGRERALRISLRNHSNAG